MQLSNEVADRLLDRLATDDAFRETFRKDPRAALADVGHAPAADRSVASGAWDCLAVSSLASKETIAASRDTLRRQLVQAQAGANPITLENARR
jgi:putative modified peptide